MTWLKNSAGKPDAMLTCAVSAFVVCSILLLVSVFGGTEFNIWGQKIVFSTIDKTLFTAYFAGAFSAYVVRRNKKDQIESDEVRAQLETGILND